MNGFSQTARWITLSESTNRLFVGHRIAPTASRPRILLLHGNPAAMDDWSALAHALPDFELLVPDLPGFGQSDDVPLRPGTSALDIAADSALAAARQFGWEEPFYVLGHSHGAGVAQALAARHPRAVSGLVLLASLGVPAHPAYRQLAIPGMAALLRVPAALVGWRAATPLMRSVLRGIMRPMFAPLPVPEALVVEQLVTFSRRPALFSQMARVARENPSAQLARDAERITAPVFFVHGAADQLVPTAYARQICDLLSAARSTDFAVLPDAGHMLHVTHAEPVSKLVGPWLQREAAKAQRAGASAAGS